MFTHAGIVNDVFGANVPDTNVPAQKVIVDVAKPEVQSQGEAPKFAYQPQVAFFLPWGPAPQRGEAISWGPHHAWWPGKRVDKLSNDMAP